MLALYLETGFCEKSTIDCVSESRHLYPAPPFVNVEMPTDGVRLDVDGTFFIRPAGSNIQVINIDWWGEGAHALTICDLIYGTFFHRNRSQDRVPTCAIKCQTTDDYYSYYYYYYYY